jgi:hypothetical protein
MLLGANPQGDAGRVNPNGTPMRDCAARTMLELHRTEHDC